MSENQLTVQEIKDLMETMSRFGLGKLKLEQGDFCLKLENCRVERADGRQSLQTVVAEGDAAVTQVPRTAAPADDGCALVTSPIVGTFYAAPSPEAAPFVKVGSKVGKGDVLFIIESMKLMNEITSDYDGVVIEILTENAQGVEYGQPILKIK